MIPLRLEFRPLLDSDEQYSSIELWNLQDSNLIVI